MILIGLQLAHSAEDTQFKLRHVTSASSLPSGTEKSALRERSKTWSPETKRKADGLGLKKNNILSWKKKDPLLDILEEA